MHGCLCKIMSGVQFRISEQKILFKKIFLYSLFNIEYFLFLYLSSTFSCIWFYFWHGIVCWMNSPVSALHASAYTVSNYCSLLRKSLLISSSLLLHFLSFLIFFPFFFLVFFIPLLLVLLYIFIFFPFTSLISSFDHFFLCLLLLFMTLESVKQ